MIFHTLFPILKLLLFKGKCKTQMYCTSQEHNRILKQCVYSILYFCLNSYDVYLRDISLINTSFAQSVCAVHLFQWQKHFASCKTLR